MRQYHFRNFFGYTVAPSGKLINVNIEIGTGYNVSSEEKKILKNKHEEIVLKTLPELKSDRLKSFFKGTELNKYFNVEKITYNIYSTFNIIHIGVGLAINCNQDYILYSKNEYDYKKNCMGRIQLFKLEISIKEIKCLIDVKSAEFYPKDFNNTFLGRIEDYIKKIEVILKDIFDTSDLKNLKHIKNPDYFLID